MRVRKSERSKELSGTQTASRSRREAEYPVLEEVPEAPDWLDAQAKEEFDELAEMMVGAGVLVRGEERQLAEMCQMSSDIITLRRIGQKPSAANQREYFNRVKHFGLTPGSRSMVVQQGPGAKSDEKTPKKTGFDLI